MFRGDAKVRLRASCHLIGLDPLRMGSNSCEHYAQMDPINAPGIDGKELAKRMFILPHTNREIPALASVSAPVFVKHEGIQVVVAFQIFLVPL